MELLSNFQMISKTIPLKDYLKVKVDLVIFSDQQFQDKRVKMVFLLPLESLAAIVQIEKPPASVLVRFARIIVILIHEDSLDKLINII